MQTDLPSLSHQQEPRFVLAQLFIHCEDVAFNFASWIRGRFESVGLVEGKQAQLHGLSNISI